MRKRLQSQSSSLAEIEHETEKTLWEVEQVIGASIDTKGASWFLIKWKGFGDEENTWERQHAVRKASKLIQKFYLEFR